MSHANIWAPWRMAYLKSLTANTGEEVADRGAEPNFFRRYWLNPDQDEQNLVVWRDEQGLLLLNRYPYANGHLLVALSDAAPTLLEYTEAQRAAFWALLEKACTLVHHTFNPQGLNIGINEGEAAGAGVPEHLHAHVVPRWGGDTNFMAVVGQVRVAPEALEEVARSYREAVQSGVLGTPPKRG